MYVEDQIDIEVLNAALSIVTDRLTIIRCT